jgi:inosose dehydratase
VLVLALHSTPERRRVAGRVAPDGSDGLDERQWRSVATGLDRLGERVREMDMWVAVHPHAATYLETREELDQLCRRTDLALVGYCPDTGHLAYGGVDPVAAVVDYASRVRHVHVKDIDAAVLERVRTEQLSFYQAAKDGVFVPLGEGSVNFEAIIGALRQTRYDGWLVVEQDGAATPFDAAVRSRAYLREHFGL